ncbi:hypothetical protein, partial [Shigella flexneri]|uniref:hypothetical protein n=1 Tax=Shigella flexneri TaxID=623 RepID=UPI003CC80BFC
MLLIEIGSLWGSLKAAQYDPKPKIDVGDHLQLYQRRLKHRVLDNMAKRANTNLVAKRLPHTYLAEVKWHTEFGHLNRGDMLTSEQ